MRNLFVAVFALVLVFALTTNSSAQIGNTASGGANYTSTISGGVAIVMADGNLDELSRGYTYTLDADPNNGDFPVSPVINTNETGTPMNIEVDADPGASVTLTFTLPTSLLGTTIGATLPCSFASNSLYSEDSATRFDPNSPVTFTMSGGGVALFDLGITITVPVTAAIDQYTGQVFLLASITGL